MVTITVTASIGLPPGVAYVYQAVTPVVITKVVFSVYAALLLRPMHS